MVFQWLFTPSLLHSTAKQETLGVDAPFLASARNAGLLGRALLSSRNVKRLLHDPTRCHARQDHHRLVRRERKNAIAAFSQQGTNCNGYDA